MNLWGASAVITGASRGIGKALALRLASEGADLLLASRDAEALKSAIEECRERSPRSDAAIEYITADLSEIDGAKALGETLAARRIGPDILVNNAGVALQGTAWEMGAKELDRVFRTNVLSLMALCHALIPGMISKGGGHIVNISSSAAAKPKGGMAVYGASKAAVAAYSLALAEELAPFGVKVSAVYPGATKTVMLDALSVTTPKDQWLEPDDIAEAIVSLLTQNRRAIIRELHVAPSRLP